MKSNEEWSLQLWMQFMQLHKEAWKKIQDFIYIILTGTYEPTIDQLPSVGQSIVPVSRGHGFKPCWSPEFYSGFFTQLHKLRSQLRGSFFIWKLSWQLNFNHPSFPHPPLLPLLRPLALKYTYDNLTIDDIHNIWGGQSQGLIERSGSWKCLVCCLLNTALCMGQFACIVFQFYLRFSYFIVREKLQNLRDKICCNSTCNRRWS